MTDAEHEHALAMVRLKIRAGLILCREWPPPADMDEARRLALLDRLAAEYLRQQTESFRAYQ